jgi:hypothetical protein
MLDIPVSAPASDQALSTRARACLDYPFKFVNHIVALHRRSSNYIRADATLVRCAMTGSGCICCQARQQEADPISHVRMMTSERRAERKILTNWTGALMACRIHRTGTVRRRRDVSSPRATLTVTDPFGNRDCCLVSLSASISTSRFWRAIASVRSTINSTAPLRAKFGSWLYLITRGNFQKFG